MKNFKYIVLLILLGKGLCGITQTPFTPGNIVVYRVGDGSAVLSGNATGVYLDEYTPAGTLVQSILMPATGSKKVTLGGSIVNSGFLTLSSDGKYLIVPGFNAAPGLDVSAAGAERAIGLVDFNGSVSSVTTIPQPVGSNSFIMSAASDNGTNLWFTGGPGIDYTTVGASSSTTIANQGGAVSVSVNVSNGQLYANLGGDKIYKIGSGLPATTGQSFTSLPGNGDINHLQFAFADLDATVPGVDVLYAASGAVPDGGLKKYSLVNGNWVLNGTVGVRTDRYSGIAVKVSGNSVTVFATRIGNNSVTVRGGELISLTDNSGYNGTFTGTPTVLASVATPDTKAFRGVALVPQRVPYTPGNIVVYRVGDGSAVLSGNATGIYLDEYTPAGALVQSILMPATGSKKVTLGGSIVNSGFLTLSSDGRYLVVPGFNAAPGLDVSAAGAERAIGLVDFNGSVSSVTTIPQPVGSNSFIMSAASDNGTNLWFTGGPGIDYTTVGASSSTTIANQGGAVSVSVNVSNGQLYANLGGDKIYKIGSGLPATTGQSFTSLPGNGDINHLQFAFADLDATVPGVDVLYAASGAVPDGGLKKYSLVNGNWVLNGTVGVRTDRYSGIAVKVSGNSVTVFATRIGNNSVTVRGGELISLTDNSGYNGTFTGTPTVLASVATPDTKAFRGVARVPVGCQPVSSLRVPDISASQANIAWNAPAGGGGKYEYAITTSPTPPSSGNVTTATGATATGLTNATTYYVHVRAVCSATSNSEWTTISFVTGCKEPASPAVNIIIAKTGVVNVKWNRVFGAAGYEYYISTSATPPLSGTSINDTTFSVSNLNAVTQYYLHIRSACGGGAYSPWVTKAFTTGCFAPSPEVTALAKAAGVKWSNIPNAIKYEYSLSFSPAKPLSGTFTNDTVYLINNVNDGTAYYFHIRAICITGAVSEWNTIPFNVQGLQVYPNPVQDMLNIRLNGTATSSAEVTIGDAMGRVVTRMRVTGNQASVNVKGWATGIYYVRYEDGVNKYLVRVVKQ